MVTGDMGTLMPISCVPVLPGDTMQGHTSALIRLSPLNTPVMHPVQARVHSFFVPNRLVWDGWEDFITGGNGTDPSPSLPTFLTTETENRVHNYMGVPPIPGVEVSQLPVRAYARIFNEYYADQDLITPQPEDSTEPRKVAWEKDYFTTARPWSQKGPQVTLPIGNQAPIHIGSGFESKPSIYSDFENDQRFISPAGLECEVGAEDVAALDINKLYADLSQADTVNVNDFRAAFSIQRYQEARARYGSRFTEYLRYLGVNPSDARIQRPEFLGGGSTRLNFSEVLQTSPNANDEDGVGDLYGHGIAGLRSNKWRKFFEEHGYVITLLSVRPKSIYENGIPREWLKKTKEDFYQKELVNLGQQEVLKAELYAEPNGEVFGYQDRYHEYRSVPSQVANEFRNTLNSWHLARTLTDTTTLNGAFINCLPSKRIFQNQSTDHCLWIMANNHLVARRLVPKRAYPRIL